ESQRVFGPTTMAGHALAATVELPETLSLLLAFSRLGKGRERRGVNHLHFTAVGWDQVRVRLIVAPGKRVRVPVNAVEVQHLRLQPAACQGERSNQHCIFGEVHSEVMPVHHAGDWLTVARIKGRKGYTWEGGPVLRGCAVVPLPRVHLERDHSCR